MGRKNVDPHYCLCFIFTIIAQALIILVKFGYSFVNTKNNVSFDTSETLSSALFSCKLLLQLQATTFELTEVKTTVESYVVILGRVMN